MKHERIQSRTSPPVGGVVRVAVKSVLVVSVEVDGIEVHLAPLPKLLVERLAMAPPGRFVSRVDLLEYVYPNADDQPDTGWSVILQMIAQLRAKGIGIQVMPFYGVRLTPAEDQE